MPWYMNYKQVLSLLMFVAGIILIVLGNEAIGIPLLAAASGVTIGTGKLGVRKIVPLFLMCALFLPATGCKVGTLAVDAIAPGITKVLDRHDAYVQADAALDAFYKTVYLRTSALIRKLLKEAQSDA